MPEVITGGKEIELANESTRTDNHRGRGAPSQDGAQNGATHRRQQQQRKRKEKSYSPPHTHRSSLTDAWNETRDAQGWKARDERAPVLALACGLTTVGQRHQPCQTEHFGAFLAHMPCSAAHGAAGGPTRLAVPGNDDERPRCRVPGGAGVSTAALRSPIG